MIAFKESEYNPLDEQKIRTQVEFDSLTDAVKSVKFHPTRDKGREVAIYKLKDGTFTPVTLPNGPLKRFSKQKAQSVSPQ